MTPARMNSAPPTISSPPDSAPAVEEDDGEAEQHRNERNTEGISAPEVPIGADHADLVGQQVPSDASHGEAHEEVPETSGRATHVGVTAVVHEFEDIKPALP